jgi:hypothetical protein
VLVVLEHRDGYENNGNGGDQRCGDAGAGTLRRVQSQGDPQKRTKERSAGHKKQGAPVPQGNADPVPPAGEKKQKGKTHNARQRTDLGGCERIVRWSAVATEYQAKRLAERAEKREPGTPDAVVSTISHPIIAVIGGTEE